MSWVKRPRRSLVPFSSVGRRRAAGRQVLDDAAHWNDDTPPPSPDLLPAFVGWNPGPWEAGSVLPLSAAQLFYVCRQVLAFAQVVLELVLLPTPDGGNHRLHHHACLPSLIREGPLTNSPRPGSPQQGQCSSARSLVAGPASLPRADGSEPPPLCLSGVGTTASAHRSPAQLAWTHGTCPPTPPLWLSQQRKAGQPLARTGSVPASSAAQPVLHRKTKKALPPGPERGQAPGGGAGCRAPAWAWVSSRDKEQGWPGCRGSSQF